MAEVLGAVWFSRALKGTIHRPNWTQANPNCACVFHPNICGVQRTSWKRLVCRENKPIWAPRAFLCPSSPPLSLRDTSLSFIFPLHSQFCLCDLYCVSVGALFPRSKETIIVAFRPPNKHRQKLCEIKLCLYGLLLCCSELHIMGLLKFDLPWVTYH